MTNSILVLVYSLILLLLSTLPLLNIYYWFVRALDFPRGQLLLIELVSFTAIFLLAEPSKARYFALSFVTLAMVVDLYRVSPYLPIYPKEAMDTEVASQDPVIKVLSFNVFIKNKNFTALIDLIEREAPDLVVLLETDDKWVKAMSGLREIFPHHKFVSKENTYGIIMLSKFPIIKIDVLFLVDKDVPSIFADLSVGDQKVKLAVLHPRPPRPKEGSSLQRDGELAMAATELKKFKSQPMLVVGDFNDVAWSHTSRLFKRVAGLLDPRVGRGFYNTFHTSYPLIRIPLDHIFHNQFFKVRTLTVLEDIGSDHYPILGEFSLEPPEESQEGPKGPTEEDMEEIKETEQDSKAWTGPEVEDSEQTE